MTASCCSLVHGAPEIPWKHQQQQQQQQNVALENESLGLTVVSGEERIFAGCKIFFYGKGLFAAVKAKAAISGDEVLCLEQERKTFHCCCCSAVLLQSLEKKRAAAAAAGHHTWAHFRSTDTHTQMCIQKGKVAKSWQCLLHTHTHFPLFVKISPSLFLGSSSKALSFQ